MMQSSPLVEGGLALVRTRDEAMALTTSATVDEHQSLCYMYLFPENPLPEQGGPCETLSFPHTLQVPRSFMRLLWVSEAPLGFQKTKNWLEMYCFSLLRCLAAYKDPWAAEAHGRIS